MKLYHGTTARNLKAIRNHGLRTRASSGKATNWGSNPSHLRAIYLTNAYAGFYANAACKGNDKWAILEIDTEKLFPFCFGPDEDFIEQAGRGKDGIPGDMYERTKRISAVLEEDYSGPIESPAVALSLKHLGNCTYFGNIQPGAITRIALIDPKKAQEFTFRAFDPTITLMNYAICGPGYRNLMRWLFEKELEHDPLAALRQQSPVPETRAGITIETW